MSSNNIQMNIALEEVVEERMRTYEFTISGNSFKEIKDRAKDLYDEILHTGFGGNAEELPIRYHAET